MKYIILILLGLQGCAEMEGSGVDQSDYDYYEPSSGMHIQVNVDYKPNIYSYVNKWYELQACTGLSAYTAPFIVIVDDIGMEGINGLYYKKDHVIIVEYSWLKYSYYILNHEMLHYLLAMNDLYAESESHTSIYFETCT